MSAIAALEGLGGWSSSLLDSAHGRKWGWQILYKEVICDADTQLESTVRMWQEVYDNDGKLVETHQKFPADTGHQKL
jgi:hypothetical protein